MTHEGRLADGARGAPGGVYLCQVSETVACAACCGLYNVAGLSRGGLRERLRRRTERFEKVAREPAAMDAFVDWVAQNEPKEPGPFADFHHCRFIGLVGASHSRPGCLLHPLADGNGGVDFRGLSHYGGMACRVYFCPSHRRLPAAAKRLVTGVVDDWYLYGLVVTEADWLEAFFSALARRCGGSLPADALLEDPTGRRAVADFLAWKTQWPWRPEDAPGPANYFFEDGQHRPEPIDYRRLQTAPSRFDTIWRCLRSQFTDRQALGAAENRLERLLDAAATVATRRTCRAMGKRSRNALENT